jgi:pilus assembly protein CpaB
MLTVVLAALLGVVGIVAVLAYVNKANTRAVDGKKPVTVLVAKGSIPQGTSVGQAFSAQELVAQTFPASTIPDGAISSVTHGLARLVTTSALQDGQILLTSMLARRGQVNGSIALPSGYFAVSVEVCLEAAIAGYIQPGAKVALFDTYASGGGQLQSSCDSSHQGQDVKSVKTQLVLNSAQVLSVTAAPPPTSDTVVSSGVSSVSPSQTATSQGAVFVTLAVDQKDAESLILTAQAGLPYFALLSPGANPQFDTGTQLFTTTH